MPKQLKVVGSNEILSAFLSADVGDRASELKSNPSAFIAENYGVDLSAFDVNVVENSPSSVNLSLPYYSVLDGAFARTMSDGVIDDVAGGFDPIVVGAVVAIGVGVAGAIATVGVGAAIGTGQIDISHRQLSK